MELHHFPSFPAYRSLNEGYYSFTNPKHTPIDSQSLIALPTEFGLPLHDSIRKLAFVAGSQNNEDIFLANVDGTNVTKITSSPGFNTDPASSLDGKYIAFASSKDARNYDI